MSTGDENSDRGDSSEAPLQSAKLFMADEGVAADCLVLSLSNSGAELQVSEDLTIARAVGLLLVQEGVYFDAELEWRAASAARLRFKTRHNLREPVPPRLNGARALWLRITREQLQARLRARTRPAGE